MSKPDTPLSHDGQLGLGQYFLGLDLGTTTVKSCLLDADGKAVGNLSLQYPEENTRCILDAVGSCLLGLDKSYPYHLDKVARIGICGQMHGLCMWKYEPSNCNPATVTRFATMSPLVNWMDQRCNPNFLSTLPLPKSHLKLSTGHGCATLFWLQKDCPEEIAKYDSAGTIMDLLVAILCDLRQPVMSVQNAASWGYFDCSQNSFNLAVLESAQFPCHLLPHVRLPGEMAGQLQFEWCGIKRGTPIDIALGDLQCSVYSAILNDDKPAAFVSISTSAQIAYVTPGIDLRKHPAGEGVEYFPYFNDAYLAVGASLNGGNVLATFVNSIQNLLTTFGHAVPKDVIWKTILESGRAEVMSTTASGQLTISPLLFGERHCPDTRGSVTNISSANQSLGSYTSALCRGLIQNLANFIQPHHLSVAGIDRIVATGSALLRNPILQAELMSTFKDFKVFFTPDLGGADFGAAEHARISFKNYLAKEQMPL